MASEIIERSLYNGKYQMVHNPNARGRAPRYLVNSSSKPIGVTTVLGKVLAKDLMAWAVSCAIDALRDKLPVVTEDDLEEASHEYERRRDSGAGTGSEAHALVEQFLKGEVPDLNTASSEAQNAYMAFVKWFDSTKPKVINVEEVVYSEEHDYAGTYDCMLEINGKVYLCDLKTTNASRKAPNGIYAEYFIQLGAYAGAHEEQRQYEIKSGGTNLVEIEGLAVLSAKKDGTFDMVTSDELGLTVDGCAKHFQNVVSLNNFLTTTTGALGGK